MATTNLFTTAKVLKAKSTEGKKVVETTLIEGLEIYAAIDHVGKWLKSLGETVKTTVIDVASNKFVTDGIKAEKQPDNFNGSEGRASANIQLRKRSAASGLNDIEQALAAEYNIPTEEVSDRPEGILWNPAHDAWLQKNSAKISAALAKLGAPSDIFVVQEATKKVVTTDASLDYVFKNIKDKAVIAQLLPVIGTFAIKSKFDASNDKALKIIDRFISVE